MRYVRPREFRQNPRQPIALLDGVVRRFEKGHYTFGEAEALEEVWRAGEDARLREDPRFWELQGLGHFHLSHQRLANDLLASRLWHGVWNGRNVVEELASLDDGSSGEFHVFCPADPRFVEQNGQVLLAVRPRVDLPDDLRISLDSATESLLHRHRELGGPLTTLQFREHLDAIGVSLFAVEDSLDIIDGWLRQRAEWTEVARGLWFPTDLVPVLENPKPFRVLRVSGDGERLVADVKEIEVRETVERSFAAQDGTRVIQLSDPPVERHPDSSVSWTHVLRTIHLQGLYLPVPVAARFRYPQLVGSTGNVAIHCVEHDSGREGLLWLDRQHHRFFGEILSELLEWEEAGRKLHLQWRPEAVVIRRGEIDQTVHEEECRHLDPTGLHELRLGRGESYRRGLASILRDNLDGMEFRSLFEDLAGRQGHRPSRSSIRTVLSQSPEFALENTRWRWHHVSEAGRVFRRRLILSAIASRNDRIENLGALATAVGDAVHELVPDLVRRDRSLPVSDLRTDSQSHGEYAVSMIPFVRGQHPPPGAVPVYRLQVAAGPFVEGSEASEPQGWVKTSRKGDLSAYFAVRVKGRSMEPVIPDNALCLFRRQFGGVAGSREGRIVLAQHRSIDDPETGGAFTVKRYKRVTPVSDNDIREKVVVHLVPANPDFKSIVIETSPDDSVRILAEFVEVLHRS